jgi:hypothetical protein
LDFWFKNIPSGNPGLMYAAESKSRENMYIHACAWVSTKRVNALLTGLTSRVTRWACKHVAR